MKVFASNLRLDPMFRVMILSLEERRERDGVLDAETTQGHLFVWNIDFVTGLRLYMSSQSPHSHVTAWHGAAMTSRICLSLEFSLLQRLSSPCSFSYRRLAGNVAKSCSRPVRIRLGKCSGENRSHNDRAFRSRKIDNFQ